MPPFTTSWLLFPLRPRTCPVEPSSNSGGIGPPPVGVPPLCGVHNLGTAKRLYRKLLADCVTAKEMLDTPAVETQPLVHPDEAQVGQMVAATDVIPSMLIALTDGLPPVQELRTSLPLVTQ